MHVCASARKACVCICGRVRVAPHSLRHEQVPFRAVQHLQGNPLDSDKPICRCRDCTEVDLDASDSSAVCTTNGCNIRMRDMLPPFGFACGSHDCMQQERSMILCARGCASVSVRAYVRRHTSGDTLSAGRFQSRWQASSPRSSTAMARTKRRTRRVSLVQHVLQNPSGT